MGLTEMLMVSLQNYLGKPLYDNKPIHFFNDTLVLSVFFFFRYTTLRSKHTFMLIACGLLRKLASTSSDKQKRQINEYLNKFKSEYEELLGDNGVS